MTLLNCEENERNNFVYCHVQLRYCLNVQLRYCLNMNIYAIVYAQSVNRYMSDHYLNEIMLSSSQQFRFNLESLKNWMAYNIRSKFNSVFSHLYIAIREFFEITGDHSIICGGQRSTEFFWLGTVHKYHHLFHSFFGPSSLLSHIVLFLEPPSSKDVLFINFLFTEKLVKLRNSKTSMIYIQDYYLYREPQSNFFLVFC